METLTSIPIRLSRQVIYIPYYDTLAADFMDRPDYYSVYGIQANNHPKEHEAESVYLELTGSLSGIDIFRFLAIYPFLLSKDRTGSMVISFFSKSYV